jgi:hypothetical protein
VDLHHPLFSSVTHLFPFDTLGSPHDKDPFYLQLSLLPALTHLRVNDDFSYDVFSAVLATCRSLRVLATVWNLYRRGAAHKLANNPPVTDSRFVVLLMYDEWTSWERSALGEINFWTRAEEFIGRKARGEIEGRSCSPF